MRILNFKINGQKLEKTGDFSGIIRGSRKYLKCRFDFISREWLTMTRIAEWRKNNPGRRARRSCHGLELEMDQFYKRLWEG